MVVEQIDRLPGQVPEKLLSAEEEKALFWEVEAGRMADLAQRCLFTKERVYLPGYDDSEDDPEDPEKHIPHLSLEVAEAVCGLVNLPSLHLYQKKELVRVKGGREEVRITVTSCEIIDPGSLPQADFGLLGWYVEQGIKASDMLVNCNKGLVEDIAGKYKNRGVDFEELVQEGTLGLIRAISKFDRGRGFKFSTFATREIQVKISRAIPNLTRAISGPVRRTEDLARLQLFVLWLTQELGRSPTPDELAAELEFDQARMEYALDAARTHSLMSLETPVGEDGKHWLADFIPDGTGAFPSPEQKVLAWERKERLSEVLSYLPNELQVIVRLRCQGYPFSSIGEIVGMTRDCARGRYVKALKRLKEPDLQPRWKELMELSGYIPE